jgi:hypothetical protein
VRIDLCAEAPIAPDARRLSEQAARDRRAGARRGPSGPRLPRRRSRVRRESVTTPAIISTDSPPGSLYPCVPHDNSPPEPSPDCRWHWSRSSSCGRNGKVAPVSGEGVRRIARYHSPSAGQCLMHRRGARDRHTDQNAPGARRSHLTPLSADDHPSPTSWPLGPPSAIGEIHGPGDSTCLSSATPRAHCPPPPGKGARNELHGLAAEVEDGRTQARVRCFRPSRKPSSG